MRKFFQKILLFLLLLIILSNISGLFLPDYYGNEYFKVKYNFFNKNSPDFNTVIFGSSRLYRQLNPKVLDSLAGERNLVSFNLAAPATHNPELYFLYENFLQNIEKNQLKYVFMELEPLNKISIKNITTARNYYWLNFNYLVYSHKYVGNSHNSILARLRLLLSYDLSYISKLLGIHNFKYLFSSKDQTKFLGPKKNGFRSLDLELLQSSNMNWQDRRNSYLNDTTLNSHRIKASLVAESIDNMDVFFNKVHAEKLKYLISLSEAKGVNLIFVIPPKLLDYRELLALKEHLPAQNFIDISNAREYPKLYLTQYTFDIGHLNEKGAELFTEYIIEKMSKNNK